MPIKDPVKRTEYAAKYRESRREEAKERSRKWRDENPDRLKQMLHDNYMKHREERIWKSREYRQTEAGRETKRRHEEKYNKNYPLKYHARALFKSAVRWGKIVRQPCAICGSIKSEGHHEDYTKPLDVIWLCMKHHQERHKQSVPEKSGAILKG